MDSDWRRRRRREGGRSGSRSGSGSGLPAGVQLLVLDSLKHTNRVSAFSRLGRISGFPVSRNADAPERLSGSALLWWW